MREKTCLMRNKHAGNINRSQREG